MAAVLCHKDLSRSGHRVNGFVTLSATEHNQLCRAKTNFMSTDASGLLTAGVALAKETWHKAKAELPRWSDNEISQYTPHQVGARHCSALAQTLGLTASKMFLNFMLLGNMASAAVPVSLAQAVESGSVKVGDHVGLLGFGSGLNCSMMSVSW